MGSLGPVFVRVVIRHPVLAVEAVRLALSVAPPGWMGSAPFVPLPEPGYRKWRLVTAYGRDDCLPSPAEMVEFLRWRRRLRRFDRGTSRAG